MSSSARPLIARLRRRLATCACLLALLVLVKGAYATTCAADGIPVPSPAAAVVSTDAGAHATASADDGGAPCWHDGAGGCHCACAHASALPPTADPMQAAIMLRIPTVFSVPHSAVPPPRNDLRPPIA